MADAIWTPLHARVHQTLRSRQLVQRGQRLLLAVSGGQDSLCLAQLFLDLQPKWNWTLAIAHCDHCWRSDSAANAAHVAHLAQQWQIPYYLRTATAIPRSEAEARQWRYQVLSDLAMTHRYDAVLTGHTASDRAETLLYNLVRGSGTTGLQALAWHRPLDSSPSSPWLIRPLLELTRTETGQFCETRHLPVWEDTTNQDQRYARNRIRHTLIPNLRDQFNPQVEKALAQTAELLRTDDDYLDQASQSLWAKAVLPHPLVLSDGWTVRLHRPTLKAAHLALQRRVIRQLLQQILPQQPTFNHIEKLVALISAPNCSRTDPFPGHAIAEVNGEWIWIRSDGR